MDKQFAYQRPQFNRVAREFFAELQLEITIMKAFLRALFYSNYSSVAKKHRSLSTAKAIFILKIMNYAMSISRVVMWEKWHVILNHNKKNKNHFISPLCSMNISKKSASEKKKSALSSICNSLSRSKFKLIIRLNSFCS